MDRSASVGTNDGRFVSNHSYSPSFSSSSMRHVNYSCGSCGYELNLSSTNRITSSIGSKYGKSMKTGIISFFNIDEGRFSLVDEFQCMPHFFSRYSFGLFRRKTKLLCRQCNNHIGSASYDRAPPKYALVTQNSPRKGGSVTDTVTKYDIRIRALQPSL